MFYQDDSTVHPDDFVALRGYNPAAIDAYMSHFAARDARAAAFFSMAAGEVYADDISLPYAAIRNSEIIQDFFRPLGAGQAMGARLFNGDGRSGVLSVQMPFDAGGLAAGQVAAFTALVPHVLRALRVHRQLQRSQARAAALHDSLDRLPTAVFLLHLDGRIAWANHAAETIVRSAVAAACTPCMAAWPRMARWPTRRCKPPFAKPPP
jgi:PAS domain-containing protein